MSEAEEGGRKEARKEDESRAAMLPRQVQPAPNVTHSLPLERRNESGENESLQRLENKKNIAVK